MTQVRAPIEVLEEAVDGIERLLKLLKKGSGAQVRSKEELQIINATVLAWFNNYRKKLDKAEDRLIKTAEIEYSNLLQCISRATSRDKYQEILKKLKIALLAIKSQILLHPSSSANQIVKPDFSPLTQDVRMQNILENRWEEIVKCLASEAPLAATIMMGGLLEALFLAQINRIQDKGPIFKAATAPKDKKTGKTLPLNDWTLGAYIDVGTELCWITKPTKEVSIVLRNYRNFIHPERELSTGITLTPEDAHMFWLVFTQLAQQIISKAKSMSK